jgi:hypothetical protein
MPRPYGLILGEGVYGSDRYGRGVGDASLGTQASNYNIDEDISSALNIPSSSTVFASSGSTFLQQYGNTLMIGGVILVVAMMLGGGRRR